MLAADEAAAADPLLAAPQYFSAGEMHAPPSWHYPETDVHMRFDHWLSSDSTNWTHASKLYESSGVFDGTDSRGST